MFPDGRSSSTGIILVAALFLIATIHSRLDKEMTLCPSTTHIPVMVSLLFLSHPPTGSSLSAMVPYPFVSPFYGRIWKAKANKWVSLVKCSERGGGRSSLRKGHLGGQLSVGFHWNDSRNPGDYLSNFRICKEESNKFTTRRRMSFCLDGTLRVFIE